MKILGIVASYRRLGNTEILVKEALMGAEEQGAEVDIIRWTDYKILPCEGDATCMFMGRGCKNELKDDFDYLLKKMYQFDGIIFGAPCYILEVAAIVKQFIDRCFVLSSQPSQMWGKPAGIIIPYATRGWTPYAFLQPTILLKFLGMETIDQVLVHIQAMAEASNDQRVLDKARKIGVEVAAAIKTGNNKYLGDPGVCPVCHERIIRIFKNNEDVECPTCGIRGQLSIENGKIKVHFPEEETKWGRFDKETAYRHVTYEIKPSKDYFVRTWPVIKEKRRKYKDYLKIERAQAMPDERR
ncbi:MAG: flavodoxin family protein [Dehalococcoidia bacterium]|jgi:multimeric flavodoxin WrbA